MSEIERILNAREKKVEQKSLISSFFKKIKKFLSLKFPKLNKIKLELKKKNTFSGWGMNTQGTYPPWNNLSLVENKNFSIAHNELLDLLRQSRFSLTQFFYKDADYKKIIEELQWRHYIVFNSVLHAINFSESDDISIVECGVCDGLTAHFAMKACQYKNSFFTAYLYDTWAKLNSADEDLRFKYAYLNLETTKINLQQFTKNTTYNKGLIPDIFANVENPTKINWLHIDLNSSVATLKTLEFFYDKIEHNGVILFDDYGGFEETRKVIDVFFKNKKGNFLNLPTGQGVFYKNIKKD